MLYMPDSSQDNADLKAIARAAFQTRIHQCAPSAFDEFRAAIPQVQSWRGYQIDLLLGEYADRQRLQLYYVSQGIRLKDTYYTETRQRAIELLSDLARQGALNATQLRCFDEILQSVLVND